MKREDDGLVPIGDALSDLDGPVQAIREASPQALHHFTRFEPACRGQRLRSDCSCPRWKGIQGWIDGSGKRRLTSPIHNI